MVNFRRLFRQAMIHPCARKGLNIRHRKTQALFSPKDSQMGLCHAFWGLPEIVNIIPWLGAFSGRFETGVAMSCRQNGCAQGNSKGTVNLF
jgi:hypothetical protein